MREAGGFISVSQSCNMHRNEAGPKKTYKSTNKGYQNAGNELHDWRLLVRNVSITIDKLLVISVRIMVIAI